MSKARRRELALIIVTLAMALLSRLMREPCLAPGVTLPVVTGTGCYTDLAAMWDGRGLSEHLIPYLQPFPDPVTGVLTTVEYPVLSGLVLWLLSLPADSLAGFVSIVTAFMGLCAALIAVILHRSVGTLAWVWALAPALIFYLGYNVDALPTLVSVAALSLLIGRDPRSVQRGRFLGAAALLAVGGGLKLYPLLFLIPLCLWLGFGVSGPGQAPLRTRLRRAGVAALVGAGGFLAINLPFALLNWDGWLTPFRYQAARSIDATTMSVWFYVGAAFPGLQGGALMLLATVATAVGLACVALAGWWVARGAGSYPLLGTSVALLGAYLVLNKVFSPQHIIWMLPLILLLGLPVVWSLFYVLLDPLTYWGWYLSLFAGSSHEDVVQDFWAGIKVAGILVRFAYVVAIVVVSLSEPASNPPPQIDHRRGEPQPQGSGSDQAVVW